MSKEKQEKQNTKADGAKKNVDAQKDTKRAKAAEQNPETAQTEEGLWPIERLKPVLEAVIFAAGDPLPVRRMCQIFGGATKTEVVAALEKLVKECGERGFRLMEVAGGWQFRTAPEHHETVKKLFKEKPRGLSRAMIETLSIVAYKQPATRAELEAVRGVDSSGARCPYT